MLKTLMPEALTLKVPLNGYESDRKFGR
jgi:hypothetical protein